MRPVTYERITMTIKEKLVFGLYVATSVAVVAHAAVEIAENVRRQKREKKNLEAVEAQTNVTNIK